MLIIKMLDWPQKYFILGTVLINDVFAASIQPSISKSNLKVGDSVEITATVNYKGDNFRTFKFINGTTTIAELNSKNLSAFVITTKGKELFGDRASVKASRKEKKYIFVISILNLTVADSMTISMEFSYHYFPSKRAITEKISFVVTDYDAKSLTTQQLILLYKFPVCNGLQKLISCLLPEEKIRQANEIVNSSFLISTHQDILLVSEIIDEVVLKSNHPKNISVGILNLVDKVLEVNISLLSEGQADNNSSRKLLSSLDSLASSMAEELKEHSKMEYDVSKNNIALSVGTVKSENVYITAYKVAEKENKVAISNKSPETYFEELASIFIPGSALANTTNNIYSFLYMNPHFFTTNEKLYMKDSKQSSNTIKVGVAVSTVLSASVLNQSIESLTNPISIKFKKINPNNLNGMFDCYFWSVKLDSWSNIGCRKLKESDTKVHCECDHLTNFALILDVSQSHSNPKELQWLSQIGCTISLVGLTLLLLNLILFKKLRQKFPMKILICQCTSIFFLLVIFLAGAKRGSSSPYSCRIVAGTLHYFVLTTFCWAAIEGVSLYRDFVKIFRKDDPVKFMVISSVFAWGCPLVVVLITASVANSSYINSEFCIIRGGYFYFGLLTPVAVILLMNISIIILVMGYISKRLAQKEEYNRIIRSCRIAFGCSTLLGLTWVFGLFAFGDKGYTFQILFVVFNSLQGFFLFILNVPLSREVRREWRHLIADVCNKKIRPSKRKRCLDRRHTNNCFVLESSKNSINTSCTDVT